MLADTLQAIHNTEEQAEQIITTAQMQVHEIEKQTYQQITKIENDTNIEIAQALSKLPQPAALPEPIVKIEVPQTKMDAAVSYLLQAVHGA